MLNILPLLVSTGAIFDESKQYRYVLWRNFVTDPQSPCLWIMLNPSTATEYEDDPTVRKCQEFSRRWGHDSCRVVNIFAWRSTDPSVLPTLEDPIGPENDTYILKEAEFATRIICAWGNHGTIRGRGWHVKQLLKPYACWCLGRNQNGEPVHPLYQPKLSPLISYS